MDQKWKEAIAIKLYDSYNNILDDSKIKYCDENLNEIKNDFSHNNNNYICFINYSISESNITNHILKIHLIKKYKDDPSYNKSERLALYAKFKEPRIKHEHSDPFDFSEGLYELKYFYNLSFSTAYRKYIKILDYKTEQLFSCKNYENKNVYFEDIDVSYKIEYVITIFDRFS